MRKNFVALSGLALIFILSATANVTRAQQPTTGPKPATVQASPAKEENTTRVESLIAAWTRAKNWTKEYLEKMPEEGVGYKPTPEVRSFAEQFLHLAGGNFGYGAMILGKAPPYKQQDMAKDEYKTKTGLSKVVLESYDFIIDGLKGVSDAKLDEQMAARGGTKLSRAAMLLNAFEHQTHHRGQTTIYLRMKGIVPPPEP